MNPGAALCKDPGASLMVSIVTYCSDEHWLRETVVSLSSAVLAAREQGPLRRVHLSLIDNGATRKPASPVSGMLEAAQRGAFDSIDEVTVSRNIGYGAAHNLGIQSCDCAYYLVLNPDVYLDQDALIVGLHLLNTELEVIAVSPMVRDKTGRREYLCKQYPSLLDLLIRGYGPRWLRRLARRRLERYEMRHLDLEKEARKSVPIISGCTMLARTSALQSVGGFDPMYFLYFEDFDLSLRLGRLGRLAYLPEMRIMHAGGYAARKGLRHALLFARSAMMFFQRYGWRLV